MEEERKQREAEKAAKGQASNSGNQSGLGSRQRPTGEVEADEKTEEKFVSFYDRAVKAFAKDYDTEGFQFLYAHYLTDENAFIDHPLGWYEGVSEPRVALRWGVAIDYNDGGFEGEPPVIGDPVADDSGSRDNNRGRGNRRGGDSDFGAPSGSGGSMGVQGGRNRRAGAGNRQRGGEPGSGQQRRGGNVAEQIRSPDEELDHYTGDFGEKFVRRYEMRRRHEDAYYGVVMREIDKASAGDETEEKDEEEKAEEAPRRRGSGDDFGTMGGGSNVDMNEERRRREQARNGRGNRGGSSSSDFEAEASSLAPGLMFVGVGNKSQMLANAKNLNLDLLVIFEVKIKHSERRNGESSTKSNTRLVVYSVKDGKVLDTDSKSLSNLAVATIREKGRDDPVELELDKVFGEMADTKYKSQDLPEMDAVVATKRYQFLLSKKKYDNPLPVLVEIKQYVDAGLVSQNDYIAACEQLLGDTAAQNLIDGDMKKKEKALEDYLPGNYEVNISTGGDGEGFR